MRLRPALMTCVIAALAVVALRLTGITLERQSSARNEARRETVEIIARDAAALLMLTQDYGLYRSDRAARQWTLAHERLTKALADYTAAGRGSAARVAELQEVAATLPRVFATLRSATAAPSEDIDALNRRELLTDQLINETRRVSDGAFDLAGELALLRRHDTERQRWLDIGTHVLLLTLILILAGLLLRRVLAPIDRLREVARAVEGGDLAARSRLPGRDELGQLSQALDVMTAAQQQRDAELRDTNRLLSRSEAFLARAGKMARVGGWELELATGRLSWSGETGALHGLPPERPVDVEVMLGCFAPDSSRRLRQLMALARSNGEGWDLELELATPTGPRWLHSVGATEMEEGQVVRLVGAVQDVTERRAAADALRRAMRAADAASAAKSEFLANMSHEIRTPMNAVLGLNYLLERSELDASQRSLVTKIGNASRSLLDIINAVLDLSKIEAGEMVLEVSPFDPRAVLRDVADLFQAQAEAKGIALQLALDLDGVPTLLLGDAARLRQIIANLVSNAVKFTAEGEVRIAARCIDVQARPLRLEIAIEDSGIGIPADALSRIFTPFTQADSSTSRRYGGTGLGLSIVKQLCALMGGDVQVSSSPGAGTRFAVHLPFEPAEVAQGLALAARPLTLLLASDDATQREALQRLCADLGWQAEPLADTAALRARLAGPPPDVVLLDHRLLLPLEAAGQQALQEQLDRLPHVRMSRAPASAGQGWLQLPADVSSLFDAVHLTLAGRGAAGTLLASTRGASAVRLLPDVRVLVADDSPINLEVARRILEEQGAQVTLAADGAVAVARLQAEPEGFDAVLMDVQMPVLDGLAATRRIRAELGLQTLPILALTAGALLSERQRATDAGMNGFVSKPFDPAGLVLLLRQHVEAARGRGLPVVTRAPAPAPDDDSWPQFDGIVREEARQRLMGDVGFFARLLGRLIDEFADMTTDSVHELDAAATAARLHKLGGNAGLLGALALRDACQRGEARARAGGDHGAELAEVRRLLAALTSEARPWLLLQQAAQAAPQPDAFLDEAALEKLRAALQAHDLAALGLFESLKPALRTALGNDFERLGSAIGRLDFAGALQALNAPPGGGAPA